VITAAAAKMLFADHSLALQLEQAEAWNNAEYAAAWKRTYPSSGAVAEDVGGGVAVFTGADSPVTQVIGLGLRAPVPSAQIDHLERFFSSRGASTRILVCPLADPGLLPELGARGYRPAEFENVMARPLTLAAPVQPAADRPAWSPAPTQAEAGFSGLTVRPVDRGEEEAYARMVADGFAAPAEPTALEVVLGGIPLAMDRTICLVASLDGVPAGAGAVSLYRDVAVLFSDSTLLPHRGHGVQSALLRERLAIAMEHGCRWACAGCEPGDRSQHNMERLGFQVAYTKVMMVKALA
jgi:hypothetical protein